MIVIPLHEGLILLAVILWVGSGIAPGVVWKVGLKRSAIVAMLGGGGLLLCNLNWHDESRLGLCVAGIIIFLAGFWPGSMPVKSRAMIRLVGIVFILLQFVV